MRDWLAEWDFMADADSGQAALFNMFYAHLMNALFDDQTDGVISVGTGSAHAVARLMTLPDNAWWDDVRTADTTETRDDILKQAFASAVADAQTKLGTDRSKWQWGALHKANFISQVMGNSGIGLIEGLFNRMGTGVGGGGEIVNATAWNAADEDYTLRALPSFRMIVDMSNLDNSVNIHTTGQSGHPLSEFYDNMIPLWANVDYKPMLFTREAVQANAKYTLTLQP
jgi:penicillin amidase